MEVSQEIQLSTRPNTISKSDTLVPGYRSASDTDEESFVRKIVAVHGNK